MRNIAGVEHQQPVAKAYIAVRSTGLADVAPIPRQTVGPSANKPTPATGGL